jgi:hypothetical protein
MVQRATLLPLWQSVQCNCTLPGRGTSAACTAAPGTDSESRGCRETGRRPCPTTDHCSTRSAAAGPSCCRPGSSWTPIPAWCSLRCRLAHAFGLSASVHTGKTARCETVDSTTYTTSCDVAADTLRQTSQSTSPLQRAHSTKAELLDAVLRVHAFNNCILPLNNSIMKHQCKLSVRTWMLSPQVCRVRQISSWNNSISVKFGRCGRRS